MPILRIGAYVGQGLIQEKNCFGVFSYGGLCVVTIQSFERMDQK